MSPRLCESGYGFHSKDYSNYKPYMKPVRGYDWREYCTIDFERNKCTSCHMCDIRLTGCLGTDYPRYYCKKEKKTRYVQTTLI